MTLADIAAAYMVCQSYLAGPMVTCDAIVGGRCHYEWVDARCADVEEKYYRYGLAPPSGILRRPEAEGRRQLDELLAR